MSQANLIVAAIAGGAIGFISSVAFLYPKYNDVQQALLERPPIVVMDMAKLAMEALPKTFDKNVSEEHFRNTQILIDQYNEAGYVVLSRQGVVQVPEEFMITLDELPKNIYLNE